METEIVAGENSPRKIIIDSSLLAALLFSNDRTLREEIANFLKASAGEVVSLELAKIEISNCLVEMMADEQEVEKTYKSLLGLGVDFKPHSEAVLKKARQIATVRKTKIYPALFHAFALIRDYEYVTLEQNYFERVKKLGNISLISTSAVDLETRIFAQAAYIRRIE